MTRKEINTLINKICSDMAKLESGKSQVKIGDFREVFKKLVQYDAEFDLTSPAAPIYVLSQKSLMLRADKLAKARALARKKA